MEAISHTQGGDGAIATDLPISIAYYVKNTEILRTLQYCDTTITNDKRRVNMAEYTIYDYTETLSRVGIDEHTVGRVLAAWGQQGVYAEWEGGFLLHLKDGQFAYIWGWCDTTGWGCQDGAEVEYYDTPPALEIKRGTPQHLGGYLEALSGDTSKWEQEWDLDPADLNKWHADGCPEDRKW
jgi:hypothetical protein